MMNFTERTATQNTISPAIDVIKRFACICTILFLRVIPHIRNIKIYIRLLIMPNICIVPILSSCLQSIAAAMAVIINIICKTDDLAILFFICSPLLFQYNMAESVLQ